MARGGWIGGRDHVRQTRVPPSPPQLEAVASSWGRRLPPSVSMPAVRKAGRTRDHQGDASWYPPAVTLELITSFSVRPPQAGPATPKIPGG